MRARPVIRSWESLFIGEKTAGFLALGSSEYRIIKCSRLWGLILSARLWVSSRSRRRTWVGSNILPGSSRRGSDRAIPVVIVIIPVKELILISIKWPSTNRVEWIISGRITPITALVELSSSIVGWLLCIGYVPSSLMSISSIVVGELSRSMTRSSVFVINVRERHAFFSHLSVIYSFDSFISIFLSTPAWNVSVGAAIIAKPRFVRPSG